MIPIHKNGNVTINKGKNRDGVFHTKPSSNPLRISLKF
jgi:hypothetical protein